MSAYWPWWAGAVGLAALTIGHALATDRSFGVSGAWDRVLHWRRERELEREEEQFADERVLTAALIAATDDQFGTVPAAPVSPHSPHSPHTGTRPLDPVVEPPVDAGPVVTRQRPTPLVAQAALLISIFLGGLIAALTSGRFDLRFDMGPGFRNLVTSDPVGMVVLMFVGGVLVGFGTRLAGGCSSGHGLNGCGRLSPVSLVATATFFGTAVAVSFLLWKVI